MSSEHQDVRLLLGAYVLGALEDADSGRVQDHLSGCQLCRGEVAELAVLPQLLRRRSTTDPEPVRPAVPPELLPALLHQVAAQRHQHRRRWPLRSAVAAVTVAALTVGGVALLTRWQAPASQRIALSAASGPASGHAQLAIKPWGTAITVDLAGLPSQGPFLLQTTARDGHREQAATWAGTATGAVTVVGATSLTPTNVTRIAVLGPDGQELVHTTVLAG